MSSFSTPPNLQGRRRWEWLITSVAINLVLVGLILSYLLGSHHHQPLVTWQRELMPTLNAGDVRIVDSATQRISDQQASSDAHAHGDYTRIRAILAVEPLDREALQQALNDITAARNGQQAATGGIFFEELVALSPEGRAKILAAMEHESRRYSAPSGH